MNLIFKNIGLSPEQEDAIEKLLQQTPFDSIELEDIWILMDRIWDEFKCNIQSTDPEKIAKFYQHPVWIVNGLFCEQYDLSKQHLEAISTWIVSNRNKLGFNNLVDYGGGFGSLARSVSQKDRNIQTDIFEPHPSDFAQKKVKQFENIQFVQSLNKGYDCLTCMDVLEHLSHPLKALSEMIDSVRVDGYLLIANNFYPVVKCHLPSTFYLRYSFLIFTALMGARYMGPCRGSHALVYKKVSDDPWRWKRAIRASQTLAMTLFPALDALHHLYRRVKRRLR